MIRFLKWLHCVFWYGYHKDIHIGDFAEWHFFKCTRCGMRSDTKMIMSPNKLPGCRDREKL